MTHTNAARTDTAAVSRRGLLQATLTTAGLSLPWQVYPRRRRRVQTVARPSIRWRSGSVQCNASSLDPFMNRARASQRFSSYEQAKR
jgi:hypothetical protein